MKLIKNGVINPALINLVRMQGIAVPDGLAPAGLNDLLQREWVKAKDGTVRAQLGGRFPTEEELALLKQLGCVDAILINNPGQYDCALFLGATMRAMARRLRFTMDENRRLPEFPQIFALVSERTIIDGQETPDCIPAIMEETGLTLAYSWRDKICKWPVNEHQAASFLFTKSGADSSLGSEIRFVISPPNTKTAETVRRFLEIRRGLWVPGKYLVISSQPFCEGQRMAVERVVREMGVTGCTVDVCGPAAPPLALPKWLDNLAKQLWEEVQLLLG